MPARGIRGGKLAQEILRISEQLEGDFRREFLDEVASYANNPVLKKLLKDIESGSFTVGSSLSSSLANITFTSSRLDALARKAMGRSARITAKTTTGLELGFNVINPEVVAVARTMSINLSTSLNKSTRETLRKIIQDAVEGNLTTIQAARKIRTHVGLIPKHADAVDRYYDTLIQSGVKKKLAQKQADAYAQRLLKYRSETIARTEIARAVGEGQTAMWKQMVADGYLPVDAKRVWVTALDERTCEICEPMNGVETDIFGSWNTANGFVSHPQATHPNCRCTQGIIMPKSKVGKSDEIKLSQWLLSKFNPYHDELGRFTSGPSGNKAQSYRMSHQPDVESDSVRFYELDRAMPNFYSKPKLYIMSDADDYYGSREAISSAKKARGNPNAAIKIYRAVPKGIKTINPKDWVTTSKKYAEHHARSNSEYGKTMVVIEATVKAKDISFGGNDGFEFGYVGDETISKANPYHDEIGRFTFAPAGGAKTSLPQKPPIKRKPKQIDLDAIYKPKENVNYDKRQNDIWRDGDGVQEAIGAYTNHGLSTYVGINKNLRKGVVTPIVKALDRGFVEFGKETTKETVVYRGSYLPKKVLEKIGITKVEEKKDDGFGDFSVTTSYSVKKNAKFTELSFMSTSTSADIASKFTEGYSSKAGYENVLFKITVPKGKKVISGSGREKELIFNRGETFIVKKVVKDSSVGSYGAIVVDLEMVSK